MPFALCFLQVPLTIPLAVLLSTWMGVAGCSCPNSSNVVRMLVPSLAFKNNDPNSVSEANDITCFSGQCMDGAVI